MEIDDLSTFGHSVKWPSTSSQLTRITIIVDWLLVLTLSTFKISQVFAYIFSPSYEALQWALPSSTKKVWVMNLIRGWLMSLAIPCRFLSPDCQFNLQHPIWGAKWTLSISSTDRTCPVPMTLTIEPMCWIRILHLSTCLFDTRSWPCTILVIYHLNIRVRLRNGESL